ncbi:MarR family transcriptional regulator [Sphingomonas sp. MMS24-J13]|uniref:MarR family transcriptional regulator n=1 Tax=Sphingomonas sp. MMS24-J13 TaxID=3238686 RepID=UPI0038507B20
MKKVRKLPPFELSLGATLLATREAVMAPLRPVLREHNISEPLWRVMRVINDRGAPDATSLAEVGLLHGPSVTRILKELEERKLIVRAGDPDDRRRTMVALSPEGRALVKVIGRSIIRILHEYSERFDNDRLDRLMDELRALAAAIKGVE